MNDGQFVFAISVYDIHDYRDAIPCLGDLRRSGGSAEVFRDINGEEDSRAKPLLAPAMLAPAMLAPAIPTSRKPIIDHNRVISDLTG